MSAYCISFGWHKCKTEVPLYVELVFSPRRGELSCSQGYDMPVRSDAVPSGVSVKLGMSRGVVLGTMFLMLRWSTILLPHDRFINTITITVFC